MTGAQFFDQNILRNRTIYQFKRWQAVCAIVDYDTGRQFGASVLYAYTPKPNTALYFGYSDLLYNGFDPLAEQRAAGLSPAAYVLYESLLQFPLLKSLSCPTRCLSSR